ncbi:MAG: phosphotransferase [Ilumatobacteraceae bacterium]
MSGGFVGMPFSRRCTIAAGAPRAARHVRALAGTSDLRRETLDRLGAAAVAIGGTTIWPAARAWPWPDARPDRLESALGTALPGVRILAAAAPRQLGRHRLSLLCRWHDADAIVKLGDPDDGLETEALALRLLGHDPLPGIATPGLLASGILPDGIAFLATDALGLGGQRRAIDEPLRTFEHELARRLVAMPRPAGTPDDAVPVHGDLAPWNLRRTARGLALFDWEAAGWGPPGSDLEHYRRTCNGLRRPTIAATFRA